MNKSNNKRQRGKLEHQALALADRKWGQPRHRSLQSAFADIIDHPPEREYSGYPVWHALLVEARKEKQSAERLRSLHVHVYLPLYSRRIALRGGRRGQRDTAVVSGMLFVPREIVEIDRRDDVFEYAHVFGFLNSSDGYPARLSKALIEEIRNMEALANKQEEGPASVVFEIGARVAFKNKLLAEFWGSGKVTGLAGDGRISIEVGKLLGRATKVHVPASEIEAM
jgi:transcription antitermination factor NusG